MALRRWCLSVDPVRVQFLEDAWWQLLLSSADSFCALIDHTARANRVAGVVSSATLSCHVIHLDPLGLAAMPVRHALQEYKPWKLQIGVAHPDPVVETASLAAVEPPEITYQLHLQKQIDEGLLSALQLESIVYASQRHMTFQPDGQRGGFFIGARPRDARSLLALFAGSSPCCRSLRASCACPVEFEMRRESLRRQSCNLW